MAGVLSDRSLQVMLNDKITRREALRQILYERRQRIKKIDSEAGPCVTKRAIPFCQICMEIPKGKLIEWSELYYVCQDCHRFVKHSNKRGELMEKHMNSKVFPCPFTQNGCPIRCYGYLLSDHVVKCPLRTPHYLCQILGFEACFELCRPGVLIDTVYHLKDKHSLPVHHLFPINKFTGSFGNILPTFTNTKSLYQERNEDAKIFVPGPFMVCLNDYEDDESTIILLIACDYGRGEQSRYWAWIPVLLSSCEERITQYQVTFRINNFLGTNSESTLTWGADLCPVLKMNEAIHNPASPLPWQLLRQYRRATTDSLVMQMEVIKMKTVSLPEQVTFKTEKKKGQSPAATTTNVLRTSTLKKVFMCTWYVPVE